MNSDPEVPVGVSYPSTRMHRFNIFAEQALTLIFNLYRAVAIPGFAVVSVFLAINVYKAEEVLTKISQYRYEFSLTTNFPDGKQIERIKEYATPEACFDAIRDYYASRFVENVSAERDASCRLKGFKAEAVKMENK